MQLIMRQQINLLQRTPQLRVHLSARSMLLACSVLLGALLGVWLYAGLAVSRLQQQVELLQQQQQTQERIRSLAGSLYGERVDAAALQQQVAQLRQSLRDRQQSLRLLRTRVPVMRQQGFAGRLTALAQLHVEGVWLDEVVLGGGHGIQSLSGRSLTPALVANYLRALSAAPPLSGTRFDDVRILGAKHFDEQDEGVKEAPRQATTGVRFQAGNRSGNAAAAGTVFMGNAT